MSAWYSEAGSPQLFDRAESHIVVSDNQAVEGVPGREEFGRCLRACVMGIVLGSDTPRNLLDEKSKTLLSIRDGARRSARLGVPCRS